MWILILMDPVFLTKCATRIYDKGFTVTKLSSKTYFSFPYYCICHLGECGVWYKWSLQITDVASYQHENIKIQKRRELSPHTVHFVGYLNKMPQILTIPCWLEAVSYLAITSVHARGLGRTHVDSDDLRPEAKWVMTLAVTLKFIILQTKPNPNQPFSELFLSPFFS